MGDSIMDENSKNEVGVETRWAGFMSTEAMEIEDALKFLNEDFPIRSLGETLREAVGFYKHGKWVEVPTDEARSVLLETMGKGFSSKINSWLPAEDTSSSCINADSSGIYADNNDNQADGNGNQVEKITKDSAMQIAFALKMTLKDAETFLQRCWLDALYLRDVKDVIYRCGLICGFSFSEANVLIDKFSWLDIPNIPGSGHGSEDDSASNGLTQLLVRELEGATISCPEDLRSFVIKHKGLFGSYRNRAYCKFMELYSKVKSGIEDQSSIADELDRYAEKKHAELIRENIEAPIIGVRKSISQADLLKLFSTGISELKIRVRNEGIGEGLAGTIRSNIIKNIPGISEWSGIIKKTADRTTGAVRELDRKLLILVWLSSDDGNTDEFTNKPGISPETALENHIKEINDTILLEYGFPPLDPRHPFDWAIMNTLYLAHVINKGNDGTDIPIRLENMFRQL